jgi:hypothetical protein
MCFISILDYLKICIKSGKMRQAGNVSHMTKIRNADINLGETPAGNRPLGISKWQRGEDNINMDFKEKGLMN